MPGSVAVASFIFGAILVLLALLGGGFKLFGAEFPGMLGRDVRIFAGILGCIFVILGLFHDRLFASNAPAANVLQPTMTTAPPSVAPIRTPPSPIASGTQPPTTETPEQQTATVSEPTKQPTEMPTEQAATQLIPTDKPAPTLLPSETPVPQIAVSLEQMALLAGTYTRKPDTVIRGVKYPNALYFDQEKVVVRLLREYKLLRMKVGVDDQAGLGGWKRFWVKDEKGNILFEGTAEPVKEPVVVEADISQADWIEITAIDYNSQTPVYVRWIDVSFLPKSASTIAIPTAATVSSDVGTPLEQMTILEGKYTRKPDTVIRGVKYPDALYFNQERVVVRLLREYKLLRMKVGVDDQAGLGGWKRFWVKDEKGNILFEGTAEPVKEPVIVEADISQADWIEITAIDYNSQPPVYVRWIDVSFFR